MQGISVPALVGGHFRAIPQTRPGLPRHTRSLLTLALLVALNRPEEFRLHVRAAVANGVTRDDLKEV